MHKINFSVPLSGSFLFDTNAIATAKGLCDKFPPLNYVVNTEENKLIISGELNDHWYNEWNKAVFQLGTI